MSTRKKNIECIHIIESKEKLIICTRCKLMYKCTDCLLIIDNNNLKLFQETITRFKSIITECKKCKKKIQDAICKICLLTTCLTGCS
jgi:hypothetical protein